MKNEKRKTVFCMVGKKDLVAVFALHISRYPQEDQLQYVEFAKSVLLFYGISAEALDNALKNYDEKR